MCHHFGRRRTTSSAYNGVKCRPSLVATEHDSRCWALTVKRNNVGNGDVRLALLQCLNMNDLHRKWFFDLLLIWVWLGMSLREVHITYAMSHESYVLGKNLNPWFKHFYDLLRRSGTYIVEWFRMNMHCIHASLLSYISMFARELLICQFLWHLQLVKTQPDTRILWIRIPWLRGGAYSVTRSFVTLSSHWPSWNISKA